MEKPSNLQNLSIEEIQYLAEEIASELFIQHGNKAFGFTSVPELRNLVGGRYESYPEIAKIVVKAYNDKQADLILSNL